MAETPSFTARLTPSRTAWLAALLVIVTGCSSGELAESMRDWNVLLITLDTTRQDHLGCFGKENARTRSLDGLAASGVVFDHAVAHAPITMPSHASIFTGLVPPTHGVRGNSVYALPEEHETMAETLGARGYRTAAVIGCYVLDRRFGFSQGFDHYDDDPKAMNEQGTNDPARPGSAVTAAALAAAEDFSPGQPFFLWAHYFDPHHPYQAPAAFASKYPETREGRYQAEIAAMDAAIGNLLAGLRKRGLMKRTLVIAIGDHGEGITGPHEEKTHGLLVFEDTMRVPLIISAVGGIAPGRRDDSLARQIDVLPTVLELLEIPARPEIEGASLADRLRPSSEPADAPAPQTGDEPRYSYGESFFGWDSYGWSPIFQLRSQDWKYIESSRRELYHLAEDPDESRDLAASEPERLAQMAADLAAIRGSEDFGGGAFAKSLVSSRQDAERLRALGYVESAQSAQDFPDPSTLRHPADSLHLFELLDEVRFHHRAGRVEVAISKLETLLAEDPKNYLAVAEMAQCADELGRFDSAERWYQRLIEIRPEDPGSHGRLGASRLKHAASLEQQGDKRGAQRLEQISAKNFERAIELDSADAAPYLGLGRYCSERGQHDRAVDLLETALLIDDRQPTTHFFLGYSLGETGDAEEALESLERAFELAGDGELLRVNIQRIRAVNELRLRKPEQAIAHLQWILDEEPNNPQVKVVVETIAKIRREFR